jgi:hypothetical protein
MPSPNWLECFSSLASFLQLIRAMWHWGIFISFLSTIIAPAQGRNVVGRTHIIGGASPSHPSNGFAGSVWQHPKVLKRLNRRARIHAPLIQGLHVSTVQNLTGGREIGTLPPQISADFGPLIPDIARCLQCQGPDDLYSATSNKLLELLTVDYFLKHM